MRTRAWMWARLVAQRRPTTIRVRAWMWGRLLAKRRQVLKRRLKRAMWRRDFWKYESARGWNKLSGDIQAAILRFLPLAELLRLRAVCKEWRQLLSDASFLQQCPACQEAVSSCVIIPQFVELQTSLGSGFEPFSCSWRCMPLEPAEIHGLVVVSSDKGLVVVGNSTKPCIYVYNPLLRLYKLLPPAVFSDVIGWGGGAYVQLVVDAETMSYEVFWFSFKQHMWEELPEDLRHLENGFSRVQVYHSTSDSWTLLPSKLPPDLVNLITIPLGDRPYMDHLGGIRFEMTATSLGLGYLVFDTHSFVWKFNTNPLDFFPDQDIVLIDLSLDIMDDRFPEVYCCRFFWSQAGSGHLGSGWGSVPMSDMVKELPAIPELVAFQDNVFWFQDKLGRPVSQRTSGVRTTWKSLQSCKLISRMDTWDGALFVYRPSFIPV